MNLFSFRRERSEANRAPAPAVTPGGDGLPSSCADAPGIGAADALLSADDLDRMRALLTHAPQWLMSAPSTSGTLLRCVPALLDHADVLQHLLDESTLDLIAERRLAGDYHAEIGELRDELRALREERFDAQMARLLQKED